MYVPYLGRFCRCRHVFVHAPYRVSRPHRSQPPQSTVDNRKSAIGDSAAPFAGLLKNRILFSTNEAGMCMKTNKTRTKDMSNVGYLARTDQDSVENSGYVATFGVESRLLETSFGGMSHEFHPARTFRKRPAGRLSGTRRPGNLPREATICMKKQGLRGNMRDFQEIVC